MSLKTVDEVRISGNTYPHRSEIAALGGKWDKDSKVWVINIANHPLNTMRGRPKLEASFRRLEEGGCRVTRL